MRMLTAGLIVAVAATLAVWQWSEGSNQQPDPSGSTSENQLRVSLMTSLPIVWGEGRHDE